MAIWQASDKSIYCDVSNDGTINFRKRGRFPFMTGTVSLRVHKIGKCDLLFVLKSTLTFFKEGYGEPVVLSQNNIGTTVIDWNTSTFTLASKQFKDGIKIHMLDIAGLLRALRNIH
jgi:hypothetical protein